MDGIVNIRTRKTKKTILNLNKNYTQNNHEHPGKYECKLTQKTGAHIPALFSQNQGFLWTQSQSLISHSGVFTLAVNRLGSDHYIFISLRTRTTPQLVHGVLMSEPRIEKKYGSLYSLSKFEMYG